MKNYEQSDLMEKFRTGESGYQSYDIQSSAKIEVPGQTCLHLHLSIVIVNNQ